jgi:hypothetical protein
VSPEMRERLSHLVIARSAGTASEFGLVPDLAAGSNGRCNTL